MKDTNSKYTLGLVTICVLLLLAGCFGPNANLVTDEGKGKSKGLYYMGVYNRLEADYLAKWAVKDTLAPVQVDILKSKKAALDQALAAIKAYNGYVDDGKIPPEYLDTQIDAFLDQAESYIIKEGNDE